MCVDKLVSPGVEMTRGFDCKAEVDFGDVDVISPIFRSFCRAIDGVALTDRPMAAATKGNAYVLTEGTFSTRNLDRRNCEAASAALA